MVIDLRSIVQALHGNSRAFADPRIRILQNYKGSVTVPQHKLKIEIKDKEVSISGDISFITADIKKLKSGVIKTVRLTKEFEITCKEYEELNTCKITNFEQLGLMTLPQAYACWWLYSMLSNPTTNKVLQALITEKKENK